MAIKSNSLPLDDPYPSVVSPHVSFNGGTNNERDDGVGVSFEEGAMKIEHPDGSVTIDFEPTEEDEGEEGEFGKNLAIGMGDGDLSSISSDLLEGIARDELSRKDWLETRNKGIDLLGLKIERPHSDAGSTSAPLEGMSTVRHPLLLEATISFQATSRSSLLPASGPAKVRNDSTLPPSKVRQDTNATAELAESLENKDELSQAFEKDMNHYLTHVAKEYVPDTDRMLFYVGFGGDGFKKVFNCPIRRRVVSESVDAEDLIVSNAATDLASCGRVTHHIRMRRSILRRMQILGVYRDIEIAQPTTQSQNILDKKKEEISGISSSFRRPEDNEYDIYEVYCELDLDEFAPDHFKGKGLPLPYRVTIEKESQKILDIRRNWNEDDEQCMAKQFFVQFPFIRGLGFYGLGYVHILGNTTNALTASWRLMLDNGMFSNFPGFLYAKSAGRQYSNIFRVAPGSGVGLEIGAQQSIRDAVMPLPYKEVGPSFSAFVTHVEEVGRRLASTANVMVGEGKQDAPVGTTLALIEQASKVQDSAHKRLTAAQAEELNLIKERFRDDPEAFWRNNPHPTVQWKKDQFIKAINSTELVPVSDPNNPTSLHRVAKGMIIKTLQEKSPDLYDPLGVDMRVLRIADIDPSGLFRAQPPIPGPDPRMEAIKSKAQVEMARNQIKQLETQIKAFTSQAAIEDKAKDRASRERIEAMKNRREEIKLAEERIIHAQDAAREDAKAGVDMGMGAASKMQELHHSRLSTEHELHSNRVKSQEEMARDKERHEADMRRADEEHQLKLQHMREVHQHKLESIRAMNREKRKGQSKEKRNG